MLALANAHGEEIRRSCLVGQQTGDPWSALARQYQWSYNAMREALVNCRRSMPNALGILECGHLARTTAGAWAHDDALRDIFEWLEAGSSCGGFCGADLPLFG